MKSSSEQLYARSPQPLYLQVATIFRRNIERGIWHSGQQLPPLELLVEQLGVSRATVRQSFGLLEREGLIRRSRGTGTYVNDNLPRKVRLALPRTWAETVALSNALGTTTLMESSAGVALPPALAADCDADHGADFQYLRRIHTTSTGPFCYSEVYLDHEIYRKHASRYRNSTVAPSWMRFTETSSLTPGRCSRSSRQGLTRQKPCSFRYPHLWLSFVDSPAFKTG